MSEKLKQQLETFLKTEPKIHEDSYIHPNATIIGDVTIGEKVSVWPTCVLRGDINYIKVGKGTNIQDGAIVHLADDYPAIIGEYVTVGHGAIIHACEVENECLIGMHATLLDGCVIGEQTIVGANTLVPQNAQIPPRSLVLGSPGKVVRSLTDKEIAFLRESADKYIQVSAAHKALGEEP